MATEDLYWCWYGWCAKRRLLRWLRSLEWRWNHPYWRRWDGERHTHWGPLSGTLCAVLDKLTSNWWHD